MQNKGIRAFLKPSLLKIVLTIFFHLSPMAGVYIDTLTKSKLYPFTYYFFSPHDLLSFIFPHYGGGMVVVGYDTLLIFVIGALYYYLLACLIVYVFQKIRSRSKKEPTL